MQNDPVSASLHQLVDNNNNGINNNNSNNINGGITEIPFFRTLVKLMHICDYKTFSLRDLHAPDKHRLRHQMSAVINFAKFREEQLKFYAELNEQVRMI
jgi:Nuf2 family